MTIIPDQGKYVVGDRRSVMQQARLAIKDIYDAIVELVTNADDRYQKLGTAGRIEIVIERSKSQRLLRVRDFADGMTLVDMDNKLSRTGGRVSGLEAGLSVRGTNSRGAKDIAALGSVRFESIAAADGKLHISEITDGFVFRTHGTHEATPARRSSVGINDGSGTVVSVTVGPNHSLPQHETLRARIQHMVALRDILADPQRTVVLRDSSRPKPVQLTAPQFGSTDRVKETFSIPGYEGAQAKLVIARAPTPFERESSRFRLGGILVKSRHGVHEATYFDPELETDPHALWFHGRLTCAYIDDLWNEFDDRFEQGLQADSANAIPILDPSRQSGLTRQHPFVQALFREALKRLRPLVEDERQREERQRATIESDATRRRLNALEKAAAKFMQDYGDDEDVARDPEGYQAGSQFKTRGYLLSPPFAQMVLGRSQRFWLTVNQEVFPEIESGASVQIECLTSDVQSDQRLVTLHPHAQQEGVLRAIWSVKAVNATPATAVRARIGPIVVESVIEVFTEESDKFKDVDTLRFANKRYRLHTDGARKRLRVLAPISAFPEPTELQVVVSSRHFKLSGPRIIRPNEKMRIAHGELVLVSDGAPIAGTITISAAGSEATAELQAVPPPGAELSIQLKDIDLKHQRSRWRNNVLEIAARHPSLSRYLGSKAAGFPGQELKHFRILVAEIVADAVCYRLVAQNIRANPEDYENADWDLYYADYTKVFSLFLPIAHKLQCPEES